MVFPNPRGKPIASWEKSRVLWTNESSRFQIAWNTAGNRYLKTVGIARAARKSSDVLASPSTSLALNEASWNLGASSSGSGAKEARVSGESVPD